ncbi:MAG: VTT domain-containing protein [Gemmatimonadota bacterium]|nr:VTT domain-containing protein [Gemmatimonadota bacterium]
MPPTDRASGRTPRLRLQLRSRRLLLIAALGAVLALLLFARGAHEQLRGIAETLDRLATAHPVWAVVLVIGLSALSAMLAFVSTAVIAPFMATTWGAPRAAVLLWLGWLLGGVLAYTIGRTLGRPVVRRLASPELLTRYEEYMTHRAPFGLVLLFQLALPSEIPGYLLGLVRYPFPRYLLALALAELPYAVATVHLGAGVMERRVSVVVGVGLAAVLFSAGTWHLLHRRLGIPQRPRSPLE